MRARLTADWQICFVLMVSGILPTGANSLINDTGETNTSDSASLHTMATTTGASLVSLSNMAPSNCSSLDTSNLNPDEAGKQLQPNMGQENDTCAVSYSEISYIKNPENMTDKERYYWPCHVRTLYILRKPVRMVMDKFVQYATIINIAFGLVLNTIAFICLYRLTSRSSYYIYLCALALSDMSNLILNFAVGMLRGLVETVDIWFLESYALCLIHSILVDLVCLIPVWIIAIITFQKMITILRPLKNRTSGGGSRAKKVLLACLLVSITWCMYKIPTAGFEATSAFGYKQCRPITLPNLVMASTLMMSLIPAIVVLIMSLVIIWKLHQARQQRKTMTQVNKMKSRTTKIILAVSFTFVILIGPPRLIILTGSIIDALPMMPDNYDYHMSLVKFSMDLRFARQFGFVMYQTNFVINFIIYCSTDRNFRAEIRRLFGFDRCLPQTSSQEVGKQHEGAQPSGSLSQQSIATADTSIIATSISASIDKI